MSEQDKNWRSPRQGFKYAPAMDCPFCNGSIIYIIDRGEYYIGGHSSACIFFGRGLGFDSFEEMEEKWETRR